MCVVAFSNVAHPHWRFVVIGNRDEFHDRSAAPLAPWPDRLGVIAGRDHEAGGTWLGVSEAGRLAVVTNVRSPDGPQQDRASRGALVADILAGEGRYADPQLAMLDDFNALNLIFADDEKAEILTNRPEPKRQLMAPGIYGLSNGMLDEHWPKTDRLCGFLNEWLARTDVAPRDLLDTLADDWLPPDDPSPHAAIFVRNSVYGTRCSTVVAIDNDGAGIIIERRYDAHATVSGESEFAFRWPR